MLFSIFNSERNIFKLLSTKSPTLISNIKGVGENSKIKGTAKFYELPEGIIVVTEVFNLPETKTNIFAQHIHDGIDCQDMEKIGGHYNPQNVEHPCHSGDLLPLLSNQGYSWSAFLDNRFTLKEIIGKMYIIHSNPDDFTTQPSGNSGEKIACGIIEKKQ